MTSDIFCFDHFIEASVLSFQDIFILSISVGLLFSVQCMFLMLYIACWCVPNASVYHHLFVCIVG